MLDLWNTNTATHFLKNPLQLIKKYNWKYSFYYFFSAFPETIEGQ